MLSGGSVVAGWDQTERAGPKDDRQVTDITNDRTSFSSRLIDSKKDLYMVVFIFIVGERETNTGLCRQTLSPHI
jgi:hypothetical protein